MPKHELTNMHNSLLHFGKIGLTRH